MNFVTSTLLFTAIDSMYRRLSMHKCIVDPRPRDHNPWKGNIRSVFCGSSDHICGVISCKHTSCAIASVKER